MESNGAIYVHAYPATRFEIASDRRMRARRNPGATEPPAIHTWGYGAPGATISIAEANDLAISDGLVLVLVLVAPSRDDDVRARDSY